MFVNEQFVLYSYLWVFLRWVGRKAIPYGLIFFHTASAFVSYAIICEEMLKIYPLGKGWRYS